MKDCEAFDLLISGHIDGMLTLEEEQVLNAHLEICPQCSALLEELKAISQSLSRLDTAVPEGFSTSVMGQIKREKAGKKSARKAFLPMVAAFAVVALGIWGMQTLSPGINDLGGGASAGYTAESGDDQFPEDNMMQSAPSDSFDGADAVQAPPTEENSSQEGEWIYSKSEQKAESSEDSAGTAGQDDAAADGAAMEGQDFALSANARQTAQGERYFAIAFVTGLSEAPGSTQVMERDAFDAFLMECWENGAVISLTLNGPEISVFSHFALVCYQ